MLAKPGISFKFTNISTWNSSLFHIVRIWPDIFETSSKPSHSGIFRNLTSVRDLIKITKHSDVTMLNFSGNIDWNNIHNYFIKFQHCANVNYKVMTFYDFELSHVWMLGFEISPFTCFKKKIEWEEKLNMWKFYLFSWWLICFKELGSHCLCAEFWSS